MNTFIVIIKYAQDMESAKKKKRKKTHTYNSNWEMYGNAMMCQI